MFDLLSNITALIVVIAFCTQVASYPAPFSLFASLLVQY